MILINIGCMPKRKTNKEDLRTEKLTLKISVKEIEDLTKTAAALNISRTELLFNSLDYYIKEMKKHQDKNQLKMFKE